MANGIHKGNLKRRINAQGCWVPWEDVARSIQTMPGNRGLAVHLTDMRYWVCPADVAVDAVQHLGVHHEEYAPDKGDCDGFAYTLRGRCETELHMNCHALVIDTSAGHAYNAQLYLGGSDLDELRAIAIEPQTGQYVELGSQGYDAGAGGMWL